MTGYVTVGDEPAQGAIIAQGGSFGGWCLYCRDGVPAYAHNYVGMHTTVVRADHALDPGDHVVEMRFDYDGGGAGKGADIRLRCDGEETGKGRLEKSVPALFSLDEGLDIGLDSLDPVVEDYTTPRGEFDGTVTKVDINVAPDAEHDPDLVVRARYREQ